MEQKPGLTLKELFRQLAYEYDEGFISAGDSYPGPFMASAVILNGNTLRMPEDLHRTLNDGDELYLIAPIGGGWDASCS